MVTFEDIINDVKDELRINNVSSYFTDDRIKKTINKAYRWSALLFPFQELNFAKKTTTIANQQYYDYPSDFITYSVWRIIVNGKNYKEVDIKELLKMTDEATTLSEGEYYYADYGRFFFLYPIPTVSGQEIVIWGHKVPSELVNNDDKTIFSDSYPNGNEAISKKTVSILLKRYDSQGAVGYNEDAVAILTNYYNLQKTKKGHLTSKEQQFLEVKDFFS